MPQWFGYVYRLHYPSRGVFLALNDSHCTTLGSVLWPGNVAWATTGATVIERLRYLSVPLPRDTIYTIKGLTQAVSLQIAAPADQRQARS